MERLLPLSFREEVTVSLFGMSVWMKGLKATATRVRGAQCRGVGRRY